MPGGLIQNFEANSRMSGPIRSSMGSRISGRAASACDRGKQRWPFMWMSPAENPRAASNAASESRMAAVSPAPNPGSGER